MELQLYLEPARLTESVTVNFPHTRHVHLRSMNSEQQAGQQLLEWPQLQQTSRSFNINNY